MAFFPNLCHNQAEGFATFAPCLTIKYNAMVDMRDYDINCIESKILMKYDNAPFDYSNCDCLLSLRKEMINKRVLAHQEDFLPDIIAFNDALTNALREMYDRAHFIWDSIKGKETFGDEIRLEAKCYLGNDYPELHPVQDDDRQDLWCAICDGGWNKVYDYGVSLGPLRFPVDENASFDYFIGMDCPPPNWNEGLDQELTKDLHLTSAFHNLFEHTKFALTDFIYVRKFETEINIEINKSV